MAAMGSPKGDQGTPKGAKGSPKGAQDDPKDGQREAKGTPKTPQREAWGALGDALGTPGETLGRPAASGPKTTEGDLFFRLKNEAGFGAPWVKISIIFVMNFRIEFCRLFDAVRTAMSSPKAGQSEAKGCQMPGQSLPWRP